MSILKCTTVFIIVWATNFGTLSWNLNLGIHGGQYKTPTGLSEGDYIDYKNLKQVVSEVISNHQRLLGLKMRIEDNDTGDTLIKIVGSVTMVLATLDGILIKKKSIKK